MARQVQEINAGSMADIAFLLLIFFLVTTTMDVDAGLTRQLPPPPTGDENPDKVNERNILVVLINRDNQLAVEAEPADPKRLKERTKEFLTNPRDAANLAEQVSIAEKIANAEKEGEEKKLQRYKQIQKEMGNIKLTKGVVSLQNDRSTKYEIYIYVQNELVAAFNELRDELSMSTWGKKYDDLTEDQQKLVKEVYPLSISEAEPREIK